MALEQSYTAQPTGSIATSGVDPDSKGQYWELHKLRKAYTDYLFSKREELDEQVEARRYYHGSQWTTDQMNTLLKRKQPVMTFNRVARKIDGVIGLIERLRQDPKAYPRTPQHQQGADLATATLRYVLDEQDWKAKSPITASDGAVDGIGGIELFLTQGDQGDPEIGLEIVDIQAFFYDPRSYKDDFSDARYLGVGKWLDSDVAKEMFPEGEFDGSNLDADLTSDSDRERRWFSTDGVTKRVRIVDCWYRHQGGWCYAIFSGNEILMEGKSYFTDEKGKDFCKYLMFSGNVDQDGDRYGFIRNMKSAQDGINARQSKMQHILASNRLFIGKGGAGLDVEKTRAEWARPDGVVVVPGEVGTDIRADDRSFDFSGWTKLLELNLAEIENFGPNPALIGQGIENKSGRAIALLQQAGMAELGPYILAYKGWKIRVYRAIWNAVQQHWKAERWIRVTDSQELAQFVQINGLQMDPMTGQPTLVNAIGSLDVDIIMDEGDDVITSMAETYEMLQQIVPAIAPTLSPGEAKNVMSLVIQTSGLPNQVKQSFKQASEQTAQQPPPPDPAVEAEKMKAQVQLQSAAINADLKSKQQMGDIQFKQQINMIEIQSKRENAELDLQVQREKAAIEIRAIQEKSRIAVETAEQQQRARVDQDA